MAEAPIPPGARRRVLVIDDELTIRLALRRFFTRMGWQVDEAANGESGLALIVLDQRSGTLAPYDLVISDLRMPGLNGIELHARLACDAPAVLPRLVFSTGDIVSYEAAEFVRTSGNIVIQKPFELATLRDVIVRILGRGEGAPS
jgi:two-component system NtrC family sensor kinase